MWLERMKRSSASGPPPRGRGGSRRSSATASGGEPEGLGGRSRASVLAEGSDRSRSGTTENRIGVRLALQ